MFSLFREICFKLVFFNFLGVMNFFEILKKVKDVFFRNIVYICKILYNNLGVL